MVNELAVIQIFPIKSLPGVTVSHAKMLPIGSLEGDRRWALFDERGRYFNAKKSSRFHLIDCAFDENLQQVTLHERAGTLPPARQTATFSLQDDHDKIAGWFSDLFERPLTFRENREAGFPDDTEAHGPTVISTATLQEIVRWYPELTVEEVRKRFRTSLEITAPEPFWEDRLFGPPGEPQPFQIGDIRLLGVNPCQRCAVPSRDPETGEVTPQFQKRFAERRKQSLPDGISREHFNHYYRLAVNTRPAPENTGTRFRVGDCVKT